MAKKPTYTVKLHAHRLSLMMLKDEPCGCCPASLGFQTGFTVHQWNCVSIFSICKTCREFVDLVLIGPSVMPQARCPCHVLGPEKALKITRKKLKEYYKG